MKYIYKVLSLSLLIILSLNFCVYAQSESGHALEVSSPIYYENEQICFKDVNNVIIYEEELYLPVDGISSLMGIQVKWNEDRNCVEMIEDNNILKYPFSEYIEYRENNITIQKLNDVRLTYNSSLVNLKDKDGLKSYFISYNNVIYISSYSCESLFFIDIKYENNSVYITNNKVLQEMKVEFLNLVNQENPVNEVIDLNTELNTFDESHRFCDFISDVYFYGDNSFYFRSCR